jgi:transposase
MNRTPRIKTKDNKVRLIRPPWAGINSGFTLLFEDLILELATNMPIHKVSSLIHESDYKIWSLLEKYIEESLSKADHSNVNKVGIDETSKSKNHNYITLFVDLDEKRTIFITEGKEHETVEEFARAFEAHQGRPENISNVSCDMLPAFIKGIRENLPNAEITFDKFHI